MTLTASEKAAALAGAGLSAAQVSAAQATMGKSLTSVILSAAWGALKDFIGITDAMNCFGGDMWACGSLIIGAIPWTKLGKIPSVLKAVNRTISAIQAFHKAKKAAQAVLAAAKAAEKRALDAKKAAIAKAKKAAQAAKKKAAEKANTISNKAVNQTKKTGNPVQKQAQAKAAPKASSAANVSKSSGGGAKTSKPGGSSGGSARSNGGSSGSGGSGKTGEGTGGSCPINNSFTPGTKVLMADGSTKPIEDVKVGDKVKATDPKTGETRIETVTAEIKGEGLKHLVKVTIDTDGDRGTKTAEITATDGHPFWVPELGEWIDATDLKSGQWLHTGAGTQVQITAVERWTSSGATVHNLTVGNTHTYYVVAAATPVLVHNCSKQLTDVALGTSDNGLEEWAKDKGYTHFMGETRDGSISSAADAMNNHPGATIHVRLDGFTLENRRSGGPAEVFDHAVQQGQGDNWFTTQREMAFLERAFRVGNLDSSRLRFYLGVQTSLRRSSRDPSIWEVHSDLGRVMGKTVSDVALLGEFQLATASQSPRHPFPARVDVLFSNVFFLQMPTTCQRLEISTGGEFTPSGVEIPAGTRGQWYIINSGSGYLFATHCEWHEDEGTAMTPSRFGPLRRTD